MSQQQFINNAQMQQLQQIQQMQSYRQYTNFQNPYHVAAWQALQFCPPINHDGLSWKDLDHMHPHQRMLQLMQQQQYIQQMANQTAIAMGYFLEQQQRMSRYQMSQQSMLNLMNSNSNDFDVPKGRNTTKKRQKLASVSSMAHDEIKEFPMSMPQQNMGGRMGHHMNHSYPMSMPKVGANHSLDMPPLNARLDTIDNALLDQVDLPPSKSQEEKVMLDKDQDGFMFGGAPGHGVGIGAAGGVGAGGEKTLYELDPRDRPNIDIEMNAYKGGKVQDEQVKINVDMMRVNIGNNGDMDHENQRLVPPPNPMEMQKLNVVGIAPNMRKNDSLPKQIPDLPSHDGSYDASFDADEDGYYYEQ